jgi:hypothetical protein
MKAKERSQVLQLLDLVWKNSNSSIGHSWTRLNTAMRQALSLAITSGFEFTVGDMLNVFANYRSERWIGSSDEWIYGTAISCRNASAYQSFEFAKDRTPFIAETSDGARKRLAVGTELWWESELVCVTSFAKDQSYLIACTTPHPQSKQRRHKITHTDLRKRKESNAPAVD